jgi:hypothetical protein
MEAKPIETDSSNSKKGSSLLPAHLLRNLSVRMMMMRKILILSCLLRDTRVSMRVALGRGTTISSKNRMRREKRTKRENKKKNKR